MRKLSSIQDLRGIAVLYVVCFHAGNISDLRMFSHGASGVPLFFIISGFIISMVHGRDNGLHLALIFIKKRVARIYFPFYIPLVTVLFLFIIFGKGGEYHRDIFNIVRNIFLVQVPSQSIHPYSWTLVYEIYYYFSFCLLVIILRINVLVFAGLMSLPFFVTTYFTDYQITKDMVMLSSSNLFFAVGAVIGYLYDRINYLPSRKLALFMLSLYVVIPFMSESLYLFLVTTSLMFLIYAKSNMSYRVLSEIGNASYSIYLIHAIVLMILKTVVESKGVITFIILLAASLFFGYLYYYLIEKISVRLAYKLLKINRA